jgi:hypothetical protein
MSSNKAASNTSAPTLFLQANGHSYAYRPAKAHCRVLRGGESRGRRSARSILRERRRRPRRGRLVYGESRDRTVEHDGSRKISPHGCTAQRDRPRRHNRGSLPSRRRIPRQSGGTSTYLPARQRDDRIVGDSVMATATATSFNGQATYLLSGNTMPAESRSPLKPFTESKTCRISNWTRILTSELDTLKSTPPPP